MMEDQSPCLSITSKSQGLMRRLVAQSEAEDYCLIMPVVSFPYTHKETRYILGTV